MKRIIVLLAAFAMVGAAVATASAAVDLYGSVRFRTYYNNYNGDATGGTSYGTTEWKNDGLTRLGMNFKSGDITGKWEIDAATTAANYDQKGHGGADRGQMRLRLAYGVWNFGSGSLLIGQDFPLTDYYVTSIYHTDNGLQGWGGLGITQARVAQMKLQFGGLRFAAITPYTSIDPVTPSGVGSINAYLPKLEVRYDGKVGNGFNYMLVGGFQTYQANRYSVGGDGNSANILSYVLAAAFKYNYKALTLSALAKYAQNAGNYGLCFGNPASGFQTFGSVNGVGNRADRAHVYGGGSVDNAKQWGALVSVGYKFSDLLSLETGYGYVQNWNDGGNYGYHDDGQAAYLQARFTVAPGVFIVPEFIYYDAMKSKNASSGYYSKDGALTTFGIMWRIDFK